MEKTPTESINTPLVSRAAQYVRMSTEHQQYSPENQLDVIRQYATSHNMEIVQEYSDHGKSGLNIAGREGLNQLMSDVENNRVDFSALLIYDVSRWGRFQDVDESAYYEYVLKRAGIRVHYCAEQFENDGSMSSSVLKTLKRSMAAEYSRELSVKVFSGQCRLIELGFHQGQPAGYGANIYNQCSFKLKHNASITRGRCGSGGMEPSSRLLRLVCLHKQGPSSNRGTAISSMMTPGTATRAVAGSGKVLPSALGLSEE